MQLAGGCAANDWLYNQLKLKTENSIGLDMIDVVRPPKHLTGDNGAMIGWMAWELIESQKDVDIKGNKEIKALHKVPLGSYVS